MFAYSLLLVGEEHQQGQRAEDATNGYLLKLSIIIPPSKSPSKGRKHGFNLINTLKVDRYLTIDLTLVQNENIISFGF